MPGYIELLGEVIIAAAVLLVLVGRELYRYHRAKRQLLKRHAQRLKEKKQ